MARTWQAWQIAAVLLIALLPVCADAAWLGYKNDTPFSIGRHMRDVLSAPIMISNDRIFGNMSNLLLIHRLDPHLAS